MSTYAKIVEGWSRAYWAGARMFVFGQVHGFPWEVRS